MAEAVVYAPWSIKRARRTKVESRDLKDRLIELLRADLPAHERETLERLREAFEGGNWKS